jgi:hypothetical protein
LLRELQLNSQILRGKPLSTQTNKSVGGNRLSLRRLLIGSSALAAVLGMTLVMPTHASAAVINYTFTNGASLTFSDGNLEDISGSFDFNTAGGLISNADITLTGAGPETGTYDANPFYDTSAGPAVCGSPSGNFPLLCMWLQTPLASAPTTDEFVVSPPSGVGYFPTNPGTNITETAVAGGISSLSTPVPEPFTLSLFGAGLASAAALRRRKRAQKA